MSRVGYTVTMKGHGYPYYYEIETSKDLDQIRAALVAHTDWHWRGGDATHEGRYVGARPYEGSAIRVRIFDRPAWEPARPYTMDVEYIPVLAERIVAIDVFYRELEEHILPAIGATRITPGP